METDSERKLHTIAPVYDGESRVLILGSFPSVRSRADGFFYAHPQNRFWRVLAAVLGEEVPAGIDDKKAMLLRNRVALWDVCASCRVENSSDASIRDIVPNDIKSLLENTRVCAVFTNGSTATSLYKKYIEKETGLTACPLPSTSAANASYGMEKLMDAWSIVKEALSKSENNLL